jgi:molybdate transport system regulatory protein
MKTNIRKKAPAPALKARFRVLVGSTIALGPGKIELLRLLEETGSISQAATRMEMSYMRAWSLIRVMNRCFPSPLVSSSRGGPQGGGAQLTPRGRTVLKLYLEMEEISLRACSPLWTKLRRCLGKK